MEPFLRNPVRRDVAKKPSVFRKWLGNFTLLLAGLVVALLVLEGALRSYHWIRYGTTEAFVGGQFVKDPATNLRVPVPGSQTNRIEINAFGFRGPDLETPKSSRTIRIAFLGGSTTFCTEVTSNSHTWPDLVMKNLREAEPGIHVDYINAAVPGYTTENSLLALRHRVAQHRPDIVIIYHSSNDLASITRKFAKEQGVYQESTPNWLSRHSRLWVHLSTLASIYFARMDESQDRNRLNFDYQQAGEVFRGRLTRLVDESQKVASLVVLATFAHRVGPYQEGDVGGSFSPDVALQNMPYMRIADLVAGYGEFNRVIQEVARARNVVLIGDENFISPSDKNFTDSFHFSDNGSRLMATRVASEIIKSEKFRVLVEKTKL